MPDVALGVPYAVTSQFYKQLQQLWDWFTSCSLLGGRQVRDSVRPYTLRARRYQARHSKDDMHTVQDQSKRHDRACTRRYGGFTLIELLIVMSLVTVLGLTTAPYFLRATEARKVRNEVETLAQSMRLARFRAVAMNRAVYFNLEPAGIDDFYSAYANLGIAGAVPTGTAAEIAATHIEFGDRDLGWRGHALPDHVEFGTGSAGTTPQGGSLAGPIDLPTNPIVFERRGTVAWPDTLSSLWGAVYVRHKTQSDLVWAIGVSRSGGIRVFRWRDGGWH